MEYTDGMLKASSNNVEGVREASQLEQIINNLEDELSKFGENNYELRNKVDKLVGCELTESQEKLGKEPANETIIRVLNKCLDSFREKNSDYRTEITRLYTIIG